MNPNYVDVLLGAVLLLGVWAGWGRGFVLSSLSLASLLLSLALAFSLYPWPAQWLERHVQPLGVWATPLAFLLSYVLLRAVTGAFVARILRAVPQPLHAHRANRVLGLLPGAGSGLIHATVVAVLVLAAPLTDGLALHARDSLIASRLAQPVEWLESKLSTLFEDAARQTLNKLTVPADSAERIELPFKVENPRARADLEAQMLEMLNAARADEGLPPLSADPELREVARAHSRDMFARGYFSHITPDGGDPFARMRAGGVRFRMAGENLALARTLPAAHDGLMNSPGHRANILKPGFGRVGIGVLDGGRYGLMVTQKFRN